MRVISTAISLTLALVAASPAIDMAAAPKPKNINVKVTFNDAGKIISDGLSSYQGGVGGVTAYIFVSDKGQLIFGTGTSRRLNFFFDDLSCVMVPAPCTPTWPTVRDEGRFLAYPLGLAGGLLAMADGQELAAQIKFDIPIDSDPAWWNVCFDGANHFLPCSSAPGHSSTSAHIIRNARDRWTLYATSTDRADLIRDSQTHRDRTFTLEGTYAMPFSAAIECLNAAECQ